MSDEELGELLESGRVEELPEPERERLRHARAALALAREADVPEPPPGYWDSFAERLDARLAQASVGGSARPGWLVATAAALIAAASLIPGARPAGDDGEWTALPALERDPGSLVLAGLGAELSMVEADAECRLEECLLVMSEAEQAELTRLIAAELSGRES